MVEIKDSEKTQQDSELTQKIDKLEKILETIKTALSNDAGYTFEHLASDHRYEIGTPNPALQYLRILLSAEGKMVR